MMPTQAKPSRMRAWGMFLALSAMITLVWLGVLPRVAQIGPVKKHIELMQREGIEVDAMFYTELNWDPPSKFR